jgi:hypothetical protein
MRSTQVTVTFPDPFGLSGYPDMLPTGNHELLVQEESVTGPGLRTHRWTVAFLNVEGTSRKRCQEDRRPLAGRDLEQALGYRRYPPSPRNHAVEPDLEDQT